MIINIQNEANVSTSRFKNALTDSFQGAKIGFKRGTVAGLALGAILWTPGVKTTNNGDQVSLTELAVIHGALVVGTGILSGVAQAVYSAVTGIFKKRHTN